MAPLLGDGEVFLRRPDGKSSRPRHLPRRALPDNPARGHGTAYDGVENLGLGRQRADAELESATGRGMPVPPPVLEIKPLASFCPQRVLRLG